MTIDVFETDTSRSTKIGRSASEQSGTLEYYATGSKNYAAVQAAITAKLPARFNYGAIPTAMNLKPIGPDIWHAKIDYGHPAGKSGGGKGGANRQTPANMPRVVGESTWEFDFQSGTFRQYEAFAQTAWGVGAPAHGKSINVTNSGVEGVDVVVPQMVLTITQRFAGASLDLSYARTVSDLFGRTNNAEFLGFARGELLLIGANLSQPIVWKENAVNQYGERDASFSFAVSPTRALLNVDGIGVDVKRGHEYLWVAYADDDDGNNLIRTAAGVYVATVYEEDDMTVLGIANPDTNPAISGSFTNTEVVADDED